MERNAAERERAPETQGRTHENVNRIARSWGYRDGVRETERET